MLNERTRAVAVINVAALAFNVVADIVLVGVLGGGITAPAVATTGALVIIAAATASSRGGTWASPAGPRCCSRRC